METLKRKPDLSVIKEFELKDGTKIAIRRVKAGTLLQGKNNKSMDETERGLRVMAAKLLVNGESIVYEDLMECFNDEEFTLIAEKITEGDDEKNG